MPQSSLVVSFLRVVHQTGLAAVLGPREIAVGLRQMRDKLKQIGADAEAAEASGVCFADAINDEVSYPHMVWLHRLMSSLFQTVLPEPLNTWFVRWMSTPDITVGESCRAALMSAASSTARNGPGSLARFLVFIGIWSNLHAIYTRSPGDLTRHGITRELLPVLAEDAMRHWLEAPHPAAHDFRPYDVLVHAAVGEMIEHASELRGMVMLTNDELAHANAEQMLSTMEAEEALLLRNVISEVVGEQRVEVERLQARYPGTLGGKTRAALDKRLERLRRRVRTGGVEALASQKRRVIDILFGEAAPAKEVA